MRLRRRPSRAELDSELQAYADLAIEENIRAGMSPAQARHAALTSMEGKTQLKERCSDGLRGVKFAGLAQDVRLTRFLESLLFGIKATDATSFVAAAVMLLAVATAAAYVPARRAARIDPAVVLRSE